MISDVPTSIGIPTGLGDDADTTGAVYGRIAGAHYGASGIPEQWRGLLAHGGLIESLADSLCERSAATS